jgi:hypothetical protein
MYSRMWVDHVPLLHATDQQTIIVSASGKLGRVSATVRSLSNLNG